MRAHSLRPLGIMLAFAMMVLSALCLLFAFLARPGVQAELWLFSAALVLALISGALFIRFNDRNHLPAEGLGTERNLGYEITN